ncbi:hypothetical protein, partial [Paenibacillus tyrfis]|uniref:hypothetical protein n=1 Tax=Paenibacillus tyrfis TaxID=1501230 RepID=UPI00209D973C
MLVIYLFSLRLSSTKVAPKHIYLAVSTSKTKDDSKLNLKLFSLSSFQGTISSLSRAEDHHKIGPHVTQALNAANIGSPCHV